MTARLWSAVEWLATRLSERIYDVALWAEDRLHDTKKGRR